MNNSTIMLSNGPVIEGQSDSVHHAEYWRGNKDSLHHGAFGSGNMTQSTTVRTAIPWCRRRADVIDSHNCCDPHSRTSHYGTAQAQLKLQHTQDISLAKYNRGDTSLLLLNDDYKMTSILQHVIF